MLTQEGLLSKLESWGEKTTAQTLRNREKSGLTGSAYRGGTGRPGRSVFYPERVLWENYAAGRMLNSPKMRLTAREVAAARSLALQMEENPVVSIDVINSKPEHEKLSLRFAEIWHSLIVHAWLNCPPSFVAMVLFYSEPMDNYGEAMPMYQYRFANKPFVDGVRKAVISVNPLSRKFTLESDMLSDINILDIDYINYDALF